MRVLFTLLLGIWLHGVAASEVREFENPDQQQRYENLVKDLRCLVCQNQSLADSDADLAKDLREEVYGIIRSGKSDQEAVQFLVDRYGDFVLYRPPFSSVTVPVIANPRSSSIRTALRTRSSSPRSTRPVPCPKPSAHA